MKKVNQISETAIAKNGELYAITGDRKVKKLNKLPEFVSLQDAPDYELDESIEDHNTKCLAKFLKEKLEGVEFKGGVIRWRGFHFNYVENGFFMRDTYSKEVKPVNRKPVEKYKKINIDELTNEETEEVRPKKDVRISDPSYFVNMYPSPADVLDWLTKIKDRPITPEKKNGIEKIHVIKGLEEKFLVKVNGKTKVIENVTRQTLSEKAEEDKSKYPNTPAGRVLKASDKFFEAVNSDSSVAVLCKLLIKVSTKTNFIRDCTKLIKAFRKKELPKKKFITTMQKKFEPYLKEKDEKPKRAPRFIVPDLWEPYNIEVKGDNIEFMTKDPSGRGYRIACEKHLYYVNQVLARFPKAMSYIMKIASGEKIEEPTFTDFKRDPFVEYNEKIVKTSAHKKEIIQFCDNVLKRTGTYPTIFDRFIDTKDYKKGDQVEVYFPDYSTWFSGKIISLDYGIKVLYEDGDCLWILNHQTISKIC